MSQKFANGDVVQLKSGGPPMTVKAQPDSGDEYHCTWFRGATKEGGWFESHELQPFVAPSL